MAIDRNAYKSLTESVMEAVNPIPQEEIAEDVDVLDEILADGVELFGAEGLEEILEDFAETGEMSEELAYLLSGEYLEEEDDGVPEPPKKKSKKGNSGKYNSSKGDCMYEEDMSEDLQTPGRDKETWKRMRAMADTGHAADLALRASRNAHLTKQGIDPDAESSSWMDREKKDKAKRKHDRSPEGRKLVSHRKAIDKAFQGLQAKRKREREDTKNIYAKGGKKIRIKDLDKGS